MSQQYFIFFGLIGALVIALCISVFVIVNRIHYEVYELKKEFRRFRDGEQYQCHLELDNPVVGVKLNADGSWSEVRANDKQEGRRTV